MSQFSELLTTHIRFVGICYLWESNPEQTHLRKMKIIETFISKIIFFFKKSRLFEFILHICV